MTLCYQAQFQNYLFETYSSKPDLDLKTVTQVHGNHIIFCEGIDSECEADGIWCLKNNFSNLAILTADCLAIAFFSDDRLALIHAGWRGLQQQIIAQLKNNHFCPQHIIIGPAIQIESYQVGSEFTQHFPNNNNLKQINTEYYFNLSGEAQRQIYQLWPNVEITSSSINTMTETHLHSFRRNGTTNRNWNIIRLKN